MMNKQEELDILAQSQSYIIGICKNWWKSFVTDVLQWMVTGSSESMNRAGMAGGWHCNPGAGLYGACSSH